MSSLTQPTNRVGQWLEALQKKSHILGLPQRSDRQPLFSESIPVLASGTQLPPSRRLLAIVPGVGIDHYALANKLWALASPDRREILLIGIFDQMADEFSARRNLVSLAAATRDDAVKVQMQTVESKDLLKVLRQSQQTGDIILCPDQLFIPGLLSRRNLVKSLAGMRTVSLYSMNIEILRDRSWFDYLRMEYALTFLAILTVIAMVGVLFWFHEVMSGGVRMIFEIIAIVVEARILWAIANYSH